MAQERVTGGRRVTEAEAGDRVRIESAVFKISARDFSFVTGIEDASEERGSFAVHFDERRALLIFAALFGRSFARFGNGNAAFGRNGANCFGKSAPVHFHDEFENVAAFAAAEAVIELLHSVNGKGRRLFLMKRTQAAEILAGFFQAHVLADDSDDVRLLLYAFRK